LTRLHAGGKEREPTAAEFEGMNTLVDFLLAIDPRDGHGWYYKGETQRLIHRKAPNGAAYLESHRSFHTYLDLLKKLSDESPSRTNGCADDANGYCPERTASISNLLAQDFYRFALMKPGAERKGDLCQAARYAELSLRLRADREFKEPSQGIPAENLIEEARGQLVNLRLGSCP
jgi:hypothetical protein